MLDAGAIVLARCMTSKERRETMRACWMKGHRRAATSTGGGGRGAEEDGKQMAAALSHQHNRRGTQDGHRPLTLTAFGETPYHPYHPASVIRF